MSEIREPQKDDGQMRSVTVWAEEGGVSFKVEKVPIGAKFTISHLTNGGVLATVANYRLPRIIEVFNNAGLPAVGRVPDADAGREALPAPEIQIIQAELSRYRSALVTYGQHTVKCRVIVWLCKAPGARIGKGPPACTCGFSSVLTDHKDEP